jgi:uncharacterized membrane protein YeaQ/YmgE (transglycosylase-associated protein family)
LGIIAWIVFGLVAGALAEAAFPGRRPGGLVATLLLGLAGALAGGLLAVLFGLGGVSGLDLRSLLVAIVGAVALLGAYEVAMGPSRPDRR